MKAGEAGYRPWSCLSTQCNRAKITFKKYIYTQLLPWISFNLTTRVSNTTRAIKLTVASHLTVRLLFASLFTIVTLVAVTLHAEFAWFHIVSLDLLYTSRGGVSRRAPYKIVQILQPESALRSTSFPAAHLAPRHQVLQPESALGSTSFPAAP